MSCDVRILVQSKTNQPCISFCFGLFATDPYLEYGDKKGKGERDFFLHNLNIEYRRTVSSWCARSAIGSPVIVG